MAVIYVQPITKIEGQASGVVQGLSQIAPELFPAAKVAKTRVLSTRPEVAVAELSFSPKGVKFIGVAMCFKEDPHGVLYAISSTSGSWNQKEPVMKQILGRFFYSGGQGQSGSALVPPMSMWKDPLEGAFTCPIPQGWKVEGGLKRFSLGDVGPEVWAVRPDNQILVRIGDSFIPPMTLPTQLGMQYGFIEGQWEGGVLGTKMLVMRYLPSTVFLTDFYLPQRVGQVSNVQARNLPQKVLQAWGQKVLLDIGEVTFDAQTEMGFRKGYAFVKTTLMPSSAAGVPGGGSWNVETFHGYLAEPKAEPLAQVILKRMAAEYQIDPNWEAQQKQAMFKAHNIARKSQQDTFDIINRTYADRSRSQDLMNENWSRAYRGEVLIQDPTTGQKFEVPAGSNYYFRVGSENQFIGTDTSTAPYPPNHWLREMRILN